MTTFNIVLVKREVMEIKDFVIGKQYSNRDIMNAFKCSTEGGIRYVKKENHLVLVSSLAGKQNIAPAKDRREGDIVFHAGVGKKGNQELKGANKRLADAIKDNSKLYYFEVFKPSVYTYQGEYQLIDAIPTREIQQDAEGKDREVLMFKIKSVS